MKKVKKRNGSNGDDWWILKGASVKGEKKVAKVMHEYGEGKLHSGSKQGPEVKSRKQAVAIAMSEAGLAKKVKGFHEKAKSY